MTSRLGGYALMVACPYCGAPVGERCVTTSGAIATVSHAGRFEPASRAWLDGFHEGLEDAVFAMDSSSPWGQSYIQRIRERIEARR